MLVRQGDLALLLRLGDGMCKVSAVAVVGVGAVEGPQLFFEFLPPHLRVAKVLREVLGAEHCRGEKRVVDRSYGGVGGAAAEEEVRAQARVV